MASFRIDGGNITANPPIPWVGYMAAPSGLIGGQPPPVVGHMKNAIEFRRALFLFSGQPRSHPCICPFPRPALISLVVRAEWTPRVIINLVIVTHEVGTPQEFPACRQKPLGVALRKFD